MKFFEHLDKKGGFYYERWGDAPVHSIGAALFAKKEQIVSVYVCSLHVFLSVSSYFFLPPRTFGHLRILLVAYAIYLSAYACLFACACPKILTTYPSSTFSTTSGTGTSPSSTARKARPTRRASAGATLMIASVSRGGLPRAFDRLLMERLIRLPPELVRKEMGERAEGQEAIVLSSSPPSSLSSFFPFAYVLSG